MKGTRWEVVSLLFKAAGGWAIPPPLPPASFRLLFQCCVFPFLRHVSLLFLVRVLVVAESMQSGGFGRAAWAAAFVETQNHAFWTTLGMQQCLVGNFPDGVRSVHDVDYDNNDGDKQAQNGRSFTVCARRTTGFFCVSDVSIQNVHEYAGVEGDERGY